MFWPTAQRICHGDFFDMPTDVPYGVMADWATIFGAMGPKGGDGVKAQKALADDLATASLGYQQFVHMKGSALNPDFFSRHTKVAGGTTGFRAELWDFGRLYPVHGGAVPFLLIPSLINGSHIFAIGRQPSFIQYLCERGYHPYVVHWGRGDGVPIEEAPFDLDDYVTQRLVPIMDRVADRHPGQLVHLLGYCMGAILALALTHCRPHLCRSVALLSPPWDPIQSDPMTTQMVRQMVHGQLTAHGYLSPSFLQALFLMMDPDSSLRKFKAFAQMDKNTLQARHFVDVETWVESGSPLSAPVGRSLFDGWLLGDGGPRSGCLGTLPLLPPPSCPTCLLWGTADRVVPQASSLGCRRDIPGIHGISAAMGHLGLLVGHRAPTDIWAPYDDWLRSCA